MVRYAPADIPRERPLLPSMEDIQSRSKLAEALMQSGADASPVGHWTQGAARIAQALVGAANRDAARGDRDALTRDASDLYMGLLQPQASLTGGMPGPATAGEPPVDEGVARFARPKLTEGRTLAQALDPTLVDAVKGFEGYSPRATWDYKQHSGGYGTRAQPGETFTPEKAEARLSEELLKAQAIVNQFAPDAPDGVKRALTSLTFNAGDKWTRSGLGAAVRNGDYGTAQQLFQQYNRAGGQVLPGLVNRRQAEAQWFNGQPGQQPVQVADASGAVPASAMPQQAQAQMQQPQGQPQPQQGYDRATLARMLQNPMTRDLAQKLILQQSDPNAGLDADYKRAQIQKMQREASGGGEFGLNLQYARDAQGNTLPYVMGKDGKPKMVELGNGVKAIPPADLAYDRAFGKEKGESAAQGQIDLQRQTDNANRALYTIEQIRNHPGRQAGLGMSAWTSYIPGTDARGFANLVDQAAGQTFLEAFNSLRGGGQITEAEGRKATQALARLDRWQSEEDFEQALRDLENVISLGLSRARSKAQPNIPSGGQPMPGQTSGADLRSKYGLE